MSEDRWQHMWDLFHQACDLQEKERIAFLDSACAEDPAMKKEILSLHTPHSFLYILHYARSCVVQPNFLGFRPSSRAIWIWVSDR